MPVRTSALLTVFHPPIPPLLVLTTNILLTPLLKGLREVEPVAPALALGYSFELDTRPFCCVILPPATTAHPVAGTGTGAGIGTGIPSRSVSAISDSVSVSTLDSLSASAPLSRSSS